LVSYATVITLILDAIVIRYIVYTLHVVMVNGIPCTCIRQSFTCTHITEVIEYDTQTYMLLIDYDRVEKLPIRSVN